MTQQILLVDDDDSFKKLLTKRLLSIYPDALFQTTGDLASTRDLMSSKKDIAFDLIVLDQQLPDGSGVEFLHEGWFAEYAVLMMSSDTTPSIPGESLKSGASYFLSKSQISEPLFKYLVEGVVTQNILKKKLISVEINTAKMETVKTLISTLRHEINNPLGAVLGAAYILKTTSGATTEQKEAAQLVEESGKRIKHVLDELSEAVSLESVSKAKHTVFHIPGDKKWEK